MLTALPGDFLFLDESGDLGLGSGSTPFFVVGILHLTSSSALSRCIKRARRRALGRGARASELKWSGSSEAVRAAVIEELIRQKQHVAGVSACAIDKGWINPAHASRGPDIRYNYAARIALEQGMLFDDSRVGRRVTLTIDARNARATETLTEYIGLLREGGDLCCDVQLKARDSEAVPQLQVADFVVGSIYAGVAYGDWSAIQAMERAGIPVARRVLRKKTPAP